MTELKQKPQLDILAVISSLRKVVRYDMEIGDRGVDYDLCVKEYETTIGDYVKWEDIEKIISGIK